MADGKTCAVCAGPLLLGDRIVRSTDGLKQRHLACIPDGEPVPEVQETLDPDRVKDWGRDKLTGLPPTYDPVPETCEEALAKWDAGEPVFTVEMGGLGPGYEQAIHIVAMEMVRYFTTIPELPPVEDETANRMLLHHLRNIAGIVGQEVGGISGGQADSAINLAFVTKRLGWRVAVRKVGPDRMIQVTKFFPQGSR